MEILNHDMLLELLKETMVYFFPTDCFTEIVEWSFTATSGGMNNFVYYVDVNFNNALVAVAGQQRIERPKFPGFDRAVVRIYNNGKNDKKVEFEHKIINLLHLRNNISPLSFIIPTPFICKRKDNNGIVTETTFVRLNNGLHAAVYHLIPGKLPKLKLSKEIGSACGELSCALADVTQMLTQEDLTSCPTYPYYDLYKAHSSMSKEKFLECIHTHSYDCIRPQMNELLVYINNMEELVSTLTSSSLPKQIIHGDLTYENLLCNETDILGILDFEFCAYDFRAMELAVTLSKYTNENNALEFYFNIIEGYSSTATLTELEVEWIPDLIILRILSNVVYFVGRALVGEDVVDTFTSRANAYCIRIRWLTTNRIIIINFLKKCYGFEYLTFV